MNRSKIKWLRMVSGALLLGLSGCNREADPAGPEPERPRGLEEPGILDPSEIFEPSTRDGRPVVMSLDGKSLYELEPYNPEDWAAEESSPLPKVSAMAAPERASLAEWQTPIRNQGSRGTCYAFAGAAALEAVYMRDHGRTLDLSEQYIFAAHRTMGLRSDYPGSSSIDNISSYKNNGGSSNIVSRLSRFHAPLETHAPYITDMQALRNSIPGAGNGSTQEEIDAFEYSPRNIPHVARLQARYGVKTLSTISNAAGFIGNLEESIAAKREVVIDLRLEWKYDSELGMYVYSKNSSAGVHAVLLVGYDRSGKFFLIKNSWGGSKLTKISYDFLQKCYLKGYVVNSVVAPDAEPQIEAKWVGVWNMDHDGWRGKLVIRRFGDMSNSDTKAPTLLGSYYRSGKRYDVNGSIDGIKAVFHIAESDERIEPGTLTGQKFTVYLFSWDSDHAAGSTTWNGKTYGAVLSRVAIPQTAVSGSLPASMIGNYKMNHDGWKGTLRITSISGSTLSGSYVNSNGQTRPLTGTWNSAYPNRAQFKIDFNAGNTQQAFTLYFHSWQNSVMSGTTLSGGNTYGALAYRQ